LALLVLAVTVLALTSCKAPQAYGDRDSVIVRADSLLWADVGAGVTAAIEQRLFTTRPERVFQVTYVAPGDTLWNNFRLWQQLVVVGTAADELVTDLVSDSDEPDATAPAIQQLTGRWARGQLITVVLLPATNQADALRGLLPQLYEQLDADYQRWIIERMYTTGVNDSLRQALAGYGFTLDVPKVYAYAWQDSLFRFSNPYRQGDSDLLRSLVVTWKSGGGGATLDSLRAWRTTIAETLYEPRQDILEDGVSVDSIRIDGLAGLEFRGVWQDRDQFPAAGPFIARAVACPAADRTYYMDAWLYAPGKKKYPYVRQLEILLDSFRCATEDDSRVSSASRAVPKTEASTSR
jgi:hypothetical protein